MAGLLNIYIAQSAHFQGWLQKSERETPRCGGTNPSQHALAQTPAIPQGAFVRWEMQLLKASVQRRNADIYRRNGLVISREQRMRYGAAALVSRSHMHGQC